MIRIGFCKAEIQAFQYLGIIYISHNILCAVCSTLNIIFLILFVDRKYIDIPQIYFKHYLKDVSYLIASNNRGIQGQYSQTFLIAGGKNCKEPFPTHVLLVRIKDTVSSALYKEFRMCLICVPVVR